MVLAVEAGHRNAKKEVVFGDDWYHQRWFHVFGCQAL